MFDQTAWGWLSSLYLLLGGLAGGLALVSSIVRLCNGGMESETRGPRSLGSFPAASSCTALAALAMGLACLVFELDNPDQALALHPSFSNADSWMTYGAWTLVAGCVVFVANAVLATPRARAGLLALFPHAGNRTVVIAGNAAMAAAAIVGLAIAAYTGMLLRSAGSIPMWDTPLLPVLFTLSSCSMGAEVSALLLCWGDGAVRGTRQKTSLQPAAAAYRAVSIGAMAVALLETGILTAYVIGRASASPLGAEMARSLVEGELAPWFWVGVVALGIAVPLVCEAIAVCPPQGAETGGPNFHGALSAAQPGARAAKAMARPIAAIVAAACSVAGSFALRCIVIAVGVHEPLTAAQLVAASLGLF